MTKHRKHHTTRKGHKKGLGKAKRAPNKPYHDYNGKKVAGMLVSGLAILGAVTGVKYIAGKLGNKNTPVTETGTSGL